MSKKYENTGEVVRLLTYSELSYAKIGKRLGISAHTVERIADREGLRRGMNEEWKEEFRVKWTEATQRIVNACN